MTQEQLQTLLKQLETKNSWGKNEIKMLILNIIAGTVK
jgi:hypothetical protein